MTGQNPSQRPEGKLIEDARKASGRSVRQVAPLAEISEARWRQLVKGSMPSAGGGTVGQVAPPSTLARMASAVGVTAEQLVQADREDAAMILSAQQAAAKSSTVQGTATVTGSGTVTARAHIPSPGPNARKGAAPNDEIDLIYRSTSMSARQKLDAIRMVLQLRLQAEADENPVPRRRPASSSEPANNH